MKEITEYFTKEELSEFSKDELKELLDEYEIEFDKSLNKPDILAVAEEHFIEQTDEDAEQLKKDLGLDEPDDEPEEEEVSEGQESPLGVILSEEEAYKRINADRIKGMKKIQRGE